ncbi:AmmeMemoRadiSam system protein A [Halanaerobacter jeridensis]|uniref:AmmeMemoRadiSam system protein A n=1 Tax=Halanaerobacter jeridensis TaxID=706427 RepID=A0A938XUW3_9FIRM|nr:AmmeMemoRadiSam system protein A [Halanaerobacter jeridensis]MBM7557988.1 AmmeMemoRadiSam system protein A [Halanaerobacter jeridensis]
MSGITFAGLSPHPPVAVPEVGQDAVSDIKETVNSMKKLAHQVRDIDPDLVITISPHGPVFSDAINILNKKELKGDLGQFGAEQVELSYSLDEKFTEEVVKACNTQDLQVVRIDENAARKFDVDLKLDHGVLVPMYYLNQAGVDTPIVPINMGLLAYEDLYKFGKIVQLVAKQLDYDVALIASGDLSHRLKPGAPAGFNPRGQEFDEALIEYLDDLAVEQIINFDDSLVEKAGECGLRPIIMMLGAIDGLDVEGGVLSYEGPFGVGYGVASFEVKGKSEEPGFLEKLEENKEQKMQEIRDKESEPVQLAREAVEEYAKNEEKIEIPQNLDPELLEQAGAFVSIKKNGNLRGCIGTTKPTSSSLAQEIIDNAIKAGFNDPRFSPIKADELEELTYTVDRLEEPEEIDSKEQLDSEKYGIIVKKGHSTGLLLPNLEGINSVKKQIEIAKRKAGLPQEADVDLMRFEVTRYE